MTAELDRKFFAGLFGLLLFAYAYAHQKQFDRATPVSRLDLLHALVNEGRFEIDTYHKNTPDKAVLNEHYYSDKAPGTVALAFPPFLIVAGLLHLAGISLDSEAGWLASSWVACVLSLGIITALGGVALFAWLSRFVSARAALIVTLALFLGAAPLPYATVMFSHALVVGLLAIAVWAIGKSLFNSDRVSHIPFGGSPNGAGEPPALPYGWLGVRQWLVGHRYELLAGFACGWALASEYTAGLIVIGIFVWLASMGWKQSAAGEERGQPYVFNVLPASRWEGRGNTGCWRSSIHPGSPISAPAAPRQQDAGGTYGPPCPQGSLDHSVETERAAYDLPAASATEPLPAGRWQHVWRTLRAGVFSSRSVAFCLAAIPPLLLIPAYSWACFGNPFILPYSLQASFPAMQEGLYAIKWPDPGTAFNLLFSPARGLFFWTPFLVMAGFGYWRLFNVSPGLFWLTYAVPLVQIVVISGRVWDWPAGPTLGPRYLAPILPLLALPCAFGVQQLPKLGITLGISSILITTLATLTDACPGFGQYPNPLMQLHIPLFLKGEFSPNLGLVLGLPPYVSFAAYYLILAIGVWWLWRRLPKDANQVKLGSSVRTRPGKVPVLKMGSAGDSPAPVGDPPTGT